MQSAQLVAGIMLSCSGQGSERKGEGCGPVLPVAKAADAPKALFLRCVILESSVHTPMKSHSIRKKKNGIVLTR